MNGSVVMVVKEKLPKTRLKGEPHLNLDNTRE